MMDTAHTNAYLDKVVEYYKDCQNDRKEIVASPCFKLEYRNQSEEQILYEYLKNKGKSSQQDNHLNGASLESQLRERSTPRPSSEDQNVDSVHITTHNSDLSLSSTIHNTSNSYPQESSSLSNSNQTENKPNKDATRGNGMLAALRSKARAQKDEKIRAVSPSSSTVLAQPKPQEADTSYLDVSNFDMNISRIEEINDRLNQSGASELTLDNEGDYPDQREKARLAEQPDLLNQTLRNFEPRRREKEQEEEKQTKQQQQQSGDSKKATKIEELKRQHREKVAAEQRRLEQEKLEAERKQREEEERLRELVQRERREREELQRKREEEERKKREEENRRREEELKRIRQREIEEEREREKARLEAQIKEEKEAKERQRIKEEQLRKEEEEEEKREKERLRVLNDEAEERRRKRDEARLIAEQIKNQRDVIDTVQSIREDLNPVPKQSEGPFYSGMQNSFSFQQGSLHESPYDTTPGSPKSQTSERLREQRGEGTTNLLNGIKGSRRINREDSRHGSNVDSNETRDRFDGRSTTGQRTIPDRLKRIEELLERVLENQVSLERRLDRIEKTQGDQTELIEDIRESLLS